MADIAPFRGIRYNTEKIKDLSKVTAPPYDVISPEEQDALYNSSPHNIINILFGKDLAGDNEKENKYTRAKAFLKEWQEQGVLKKDEEDSIYVNLQEFAVEGKNFKRIGFLALLKLEEFGTEASTIYPHENTLNAPKEDRNKLITSIEANIGPIFAIFADKEKAVDAILINEMRNRPLIDMVDTHGSRNKLWRIEDKGSMGKIVSLMKKEKLFIADGHHRYEAALQFSKTKKDPKYGHILTYFTGLYSDGLVILAVHRLIAGIDKELVSDMERELEKKCSLQSFSSRGDVKAFLSGARAFQKRFVMYDGRRFLGLLFDLDKGKRDVLDITLLHDLIVEPLKKMAEKKNQKISIDFTNDLNYAINKVDNKKFGLSIMVNPTNITEIRDTALSGRRMPQKSTYFYPKVLTGLVINVF